MPVLSIFRGEPIREHNISVRLSLNCVCSCMESLEGEACNAGEEYQGISSIFPVVRKILLAKEGLLFQNMGTVRVAFPVGGFQACDPVCK